MSDFKFDFWGDKVTEAMREAAREGVYEAAEHLLTEANKTVPHDEGTLERSGAVSLDEEEIMSAVSYDTPYARWLHESEPGEINFRGSGRRKWLERAKNEQADRINKFIAEKIKSAMK